MNKTAALLLLITFGLLVTGASMLSIPAGLITGGVLTGAAGVLSLNAKNTDANHDMDGKAAR